MAPKPQGLKLSKDAFTSAGNGEKAARDGRPERVRVVIGGTAGVGAINELTTKYKSEGFGAKGATKLAGIAYEMNPGDQADGSLDSFKVAFESPGNVPVTLVHPLTGPVNKSNIPVPDTPPQFAQVCFALPTISKASDVQGENEQQWLELFEVASDRQLTIELAVAPDDGVREAVEKLLGKAWDQEVAAAKQAGKEEEVDKKGVRILFDALASPPLNQNSSQLMRSKEMESWSDFVSRLALNPRVFLKISPLPLPSLLPAAIGTTWRPVDSLGSNVPLPGASLAGQAARTATDLATQAIASAEAATTTSTADRRDELKQRLRVFMETALEAFGEERLVWSSYLSSGSITASSLQSASGNKDDIAQLSEPEQWFEAVLGTLQDIGVGQEALDNIFSENVSNVYRM